MSHTHMFDLFVGLSTCCVGTNVDDISKTKCVPETNRLAGLHRHYLLVITVMGRCAAQKSVAMLQTLVELETVSQALMGKGCMVALSSLATDACNTYAKDAVCMMNLCRLFASSCSTCARTCV